jgi:hypothetical protein
LPVARPVAPVAGTRADVSLQPLEERIRKLEELLTQLNQLQQDRAGPLPSEQILQQEPSAAPSVLGQARALLEVGRQLLPNLPPGLAPPATKRWLLWEMIAEARAMIYMYVDPRYRMPWYGYLLPPVLFLAYLFSKYWVPFASLLDEVKLRWVLTVPVDMVLLYTMFKILGHQARRYRETAPDLPPSLRL